jgi:hypothetical protein
MASRMPGRIDVDLQPDFAFATPLVHGVGVSTISVYGATLGASEYIELARSSIYAVLQLMFDPPPHQNTKART